MKNFNYLLALVLAFAFNFVFADYKATDLAWRYISQMHGPLYKVHKVGEDYLTITNGSDMLSSLSSLPYVFTSSDRHGRVIINDSTSVNNTSFKNQCVSLVKAIANFLTHTSNWAPSVRMTLDVHTVNPPGTHIRRGSVVATFVGGKYAGSKGYGHAGIFLGLNNKGMMLFDQNWDKDGVVKFHTIPFGPKPGEGGFVEGDVNNAYAYFSVK